MYNFFQYKYVQFEIISLNRRHVSAQLLTKSTVGKPQIFLLKSLSATSRATPFQRTTYSYLPSSPARALSSSISESVSVPRNQCRQSSLTCRSFFRRFPWSSVSSVSRQYGGFAPIGQMVSLALPPVWSTVSQRR